MSVQGNLKDLAVADLIQHNCQDNKTGKILIQNTAGNASLYLKDGQVVHAALNGQEGEEVIYQILCWNEGSFILETGISAPAVTITRNWSSLLLEGARRLDENNSIRSKSDKQLEINEMSKLDDILKEMSGEITGYIASTLAGLDGINIASHTSNKAMDPDAISAQMTMLLKLVDTSMDKLGAGILEDNLTTTENAYILMRLLPGKQYYLGLTSNHKNGNLGNMRLISKMYADRLAKAMPS